MMGHCGYLPYYEQAFEDNNTCVLFIYRDLRDVAVSLTYHIENPDRESFKHPGRDEYLALPSHEDRLKAVIEGFGEWPGVIERWDLYEGWLHSKAVLPIRYEDMRENPGEVAGRVLDYVILRTVKGSGEIPIVVKDNFIAAIDHAAAQLQTTDRSGSFRKGIVGGWMEEFTPEINDLFNSLVGDRLERLGYNADYVREVI
jgi:hypothetical protein